MKHLRRFCASGLLICAFAFSAYAGDIECDVLMPAPSDYSVRAAIVALVDSLLLLS